MKKRVIFGILFSLILALLSPYSVLRAEEFSGREEEYLTLCSSSTLSKSDEDTCKEFNQYLKEKTDTVKQEIQTSSSEIATIENDINVLSEELALIGRDLIDKENEISYLDISIAELQVSIDVQEEKVKDRMYAMQTYINANSYIDFIFGAKSFTDFLSRMATVNELTAYDKELVQDLSDDKEAIALQRSTITTAKANLEAKQSEQLQLQTKYTTLLEEKNKALQESELLAVTLDNNSSEVTRALKELEERSKQTQITGNVSVSGDSELGIAIANYALTTRGLPYTWGGAGPNTYDCSGLVSWAFAQAGVPIGRTTAEGYSQYGQEISLSEAQAGDVVTYYNYGYVSHIAIFIDSNGTIVHAAGQENENMGEWGGSVRVNNVYDIPGIYNCRRMY